LLIVGSAIDSNIMYVYCGHSFLTIYGLGS